MYDARHDVSLTDGPWPAAVIRDVPVGLLEMDASGHLVRANQALVRLLAPIGAADVLVSGGPSAVAGRLVTDCWPRLAESAVTVLSGRAVDTTVGLPPTNLRVSGVPRWLGSRPNGGLLVVSEQTLARAVVVDLRDGVVDLRDGVVDLRDGVVPGAPMPALSDLTGNGSSLPGPDRAVRRSGAVRHRRTGRRRSWPATRSDEPVAALDAVTGLPGSLRLLRNLADALVTCRSGCRVAVFAVQLAVAGYRADECRRDLTDWLAPLFGPLAFAAWLDGTRFAVVLRDLQPGVDVERLVAQADRQLRQDDTAGIPAQGCSIDGVGLVLADPSAAVGDRDPRLILALALEAMERSSRSGFLVDREPPEQAERARLAALSAYDLYNGALDEALQGITQVALASCATAVALVTFVDSDLQWVRAASGNDVAAYVDARAPRHLALCDQTIRGRGVLVVPNTEQDWAFRSSRHVGWQVGMRFYAGVPLVADGRWPIGTLCVLDRHPRELSERQRHTLAVLAAETVALLEGHRIG